MELLIYQSKFILFVFLKKKFVGFLRSGLNGSAVCIYTVDQLENVLNLRFLYKNQMNHIGYQFHKTRYRKSIA